MKKPIRPIPVHARCDERTHLALPHRGRLQQGRLKTFCGLQAVPEMPLFAMAKKKGRCKQCFSRVNGEGELIEVEDG